MSPEQLQALRQSLPEYGEGLPTSPDFPAYRHFYGLDFDSPSDVTQLMGTVRSGRYSLAVQSWQHPAATSNLLLVHGYFDHSGLYGKLARFGLANNCNVFMFDLPGHGLSSGEAAVIDDFSDYSRAIHDLLVSVRMPSLPLWVMAQSTGCSALMDYARHYDWPFKATVLLAPLLRPRGWRRIRVAHLLLRKFREDVERQFTENSSDPDFLEFVRNDPLQSREVSLRWIAALRRWLSGLNHSDLGVGPALVIQGDADRTVQWQYNLDVVAQLFPGSHIEMVSGAGHHLANESDDIRMRYLGQVQEYLRSQGIALVHSG